MAGALKKTTGLTGMAVARDPHKTLTVLYEKILKTLHRFPEDYTYRKSTEGLIQQRLATVKLERDVEKLENKINCGQVEELIIQAERELSLSRRMFEWRAWEPLKGAAPENQWKWPPY